jgi:hypothetical protein
MKILKENLQPLADDLMSYCQKELGYESKPELYFQEDEKNSVNPLGKTAHYSPEESKVVVYVSGRHTKDVLRSVAHELVHHLQNTRGDFNRPAETVDGYAQKDPHLRNMEKEAYLLGNMLFRDWEDNKKIKENRKMDTPKLKEAVRSMVKKALMEKIKNPGKHKTGMKAGYDKDGDGVPNGADKAPEDGSVDETRYEGPKGGMSDKSMTGQGNLPGRKKKPKPEPTKVGGKRPGGKSGFGPVYSYDFDDDGNVNEQDLDMKARASTSDFKKGGIEQTKAGSAGGVSAQERALVQQISQLLLQAAQQGNLAQGSVTRYINMAMEKVRGMLGDGGAEPKKELEEGGRPLSRPKRTMADLDKDAKTRETDFLKKKKEELEEEVEEAHKYGHADPDGKLGSMGADHDAMVASAGKKEQDKKDREGAARLKAFMKGGIKEEYENKFADIKATSKLHETKQARINKLLMEWCKK